MQAGRQGRRLPALCAGYPLRTRTRLDPPLAPAGSLPTYHTMAGSSRRRCRTERVLSVSWPEAGERHFRPMRPVWGGDRSTQCAHCHSLVAIWGSCAFPLRIQCGASWRLWQPPRCCSAVSSRTGRQGPRPCAGGEAMCF